MTDIFVPAGPASPATAVQYLSGLVADGAADARAGDQLLLTAVPLVPEIRLHLATDAILLWARLEADAKAPLAAPFWASAWAGGQAVARHILDHPQLVRGRSVLDIGSGSGLAAIAAARAGGHAVANDIDPLATAAIALNAEVNHAVVETHLGDLLGGTGREAQVVLVGDAFYNDEIAEHVLPYLDRVLAAGGRVLIGDPGRGHLPEHGLDHLAAYRHPRMSTLGDSYIDEAHVFELRYTRG
ncbi:class I SAM-dependent methyltransferase [Hamadaea tsunoensis]|uniref:class I SAM-dependent methyltransferase n=1 Tax=Hamadaea tsunoensis TaxID=53368 RepID=UPI00041B26F7|nr:50S ribosomal protein L11 methyltransferase [Hamadaea tsunoensis]